MRSGRAFKSKKKPTAKASPLCEVHLRGKWHTQTKAFLARLAAISVIIIALAFGARHTTFTLRPQDIFSYEIDVDLQLALIGVINKVFDLLITTSLEDSAGVLVTLWMTSKAFDSFPALNKGHAVGARLEDFGLKDELTKPWKSIGAFVSRVSALGWRQAGWVRLLLTFGCSICVLLSGLAINTIGIPKKRWLPDVWENLNVEMPMVEFQGAAIDWGQEWSLGWGMVGSGDPSWHAADALITASTYVALSKFRDQFAAERQGWKAFLPVDTDRDFATVDTRYNGSASRGFAGQGMVSKLLFSHLQAIGDPHASAATGWTGHLNVSWPSAAASCGPFQNISTLSTGSVRVDANFNPDHYPNASFMLSILPFNTSTPDPPFLGVTCEISISRLLFATRTWITDDAPGSVSPNNYGNPEFNGNPDFNATANPLPRSEIDKNITQRLAVQAVAVTSRFEGLLTSSTSAAQFLTLQARDLQSYRPEYQNDIEATAPVICLLMNYLLAIGTWNLTLSTSQTTVSTNMQFEVIGSGPRLLWEWAAVTILGILLLACTWGMLQWAICRIAPAEWMEVKGMLVAANSSAPLGKLGAAVMKGEKETAMVRIGVREHGQKRVQVVEEPGIRDLVDVKKIYKWI